MANSQVVMTWNGTSGTIFANIPVEEEKAEALLWSDTLMIPAYAAAASALILTLQIILLSKLLRKLSHRLSPPSEPSEPSVEQTTAIPATGVVLKFKEHISQHGGPTIFAYKVTRLLGCLALLSLSVTSLVIDKISKTTNIGIAGKWEKKRKNEKQPSLAFSIEEWLQAAICMTYLYTSLLALISVSAKPRWSKLVTRHLMVVLLVSSGVYVYRDIYPITTFVKSPMDMKEGWILWAKLSVLSITSVVVPLFIPRVYVPIDEKKSTPAPEQVASLVSLILYFFLDSTIARAYRVPHLSHDRFPPLADYDAAENLKRTAFPHLDPSCRIAGRKPSKRHIFFGLLYVFRWEYIGLACMIIINVIVGFASPLGVNRLLNYMENKGEGAVTRPWFWIIWLFLGPTIVSITMQWYIYLASRTLVRIEALIAQLVFEHSLRIRIKAEVTSSTTSVSSAPSTPDDEYADLTIDDSTANDMGSSSSSRDETLQSGDGSLHSRSVNETLHSSSTSASSKGTQESSKSSSPKPAPKGQELPSSDNLLGKINNLVTTDLSNITEGRHFLFILLYVPLQIVLCIIFLYVVLGWAAFVGLGMLLLLFPIPGYVANMIQGVQRERMKKTDARVQTFTETMNVLKMVKLFGWERKMNKKIEEKREEELVWIWRRQILDLINGSFNSIIPVATMIVTFTTYTVIMKQELSASKVFSSMSVFDLLRGQLYMAFYSISTSVQAKVSLDRVNDFLHNTELLDTYSDKADVVDLFTDSTLVDRDVVGFRNASFSWSNDADESVTPSRKAFRLKIEEELLFQQKSINLIIGPTGSGKTSVLMALLGEMHFIPCGPDSESWFNLPRGGGIAYAAQESWVQNETLRDNILFGSPYDEARYKKVVYQCCLERDFTMFEAGDRTEVGEKGLTLSGGQKARITLARAIYSSAEILLLDDVFAAFDIHTAKWIIKKCLSGDLVQGRTILLVTHNVAMVQPIAHFIVSLDSDGTISSKGTVSDVIAKDRTLATKISKEKIVLDEMETELDPPTVEDSTSDGKLILAEEIEEGHISWSAFKLYLSALCGEHPILFFGAFIGGLILNELVNVGQTWFLGYWASQYETHETYEIAISFYVTVYTGILLISIIVYCSVYVVYVFGSLRASRTIHRQLLESVLGTTLRWLDTTPISRIIARCTQDIGAVDGPLSQRFTGVVELTVAMIIPLGAIVLMTPIFLIPGIIIFILGAICGQVYIKAQLSVKREMSNAKAPVLGYFGAAIVGLTSIRAYGAQEAFTTESLVRINRYTRAARTYYNLNRWICVRIDALGGLFSAALAAYLVYSQSQSASNTGFSLNMAVGFSGMILLWVRCMNDFEVQANSLERIQGYVCIEQEDKPTEGGEPPAYWPASGDIRVENLSARYSLNGPKVLHDISFHIKSGDRVGVVGRTGSGKSSLTLSLLRCIFTDGAVYYDGLSTASLNLDALRSNITIIPQVPELLSGTLRQNLDPFNQYEDASLNDALRAAGLFSLQNETDEGRMTLDSSIASGGNNISVGQRQIIALARALVRGSKLLILDEATSAIGTTIRNCADFSSLRNELGGDVTLITVAHRLQTIMDADKIMVLDAGRIVEFDSPKELLKNENGKLRSLVDESEDKEALCAMAEVRTASK